MRPRSTRQEVAESRVLVRCTVYRAVERLCQGRMAKLATGRQSGAPRILRGWHTAARPGWREILGVRPPGACVRGVGGAARG